MLNIHYATGALVPRIAAVGLLAVASVLSGTPAYAQRVAIVAAKNQSSYSEDVRAKVRSAPGFASAFERVDILSVLDGQPVPTLATLRQYDAVLVYSDDSFNDSVALGDLLADYVDGGGGLVVAAFAFTRFSTSAGDPSQAGLAGRIRTGNYLPLGDGGQNRSNNESDSMKVPVAAAHASHPVLDGVTAFDGGRASFHNQSNATTGATVLATWTKSGFPLVAVKAVQGSRIVALNFFPPSGDAEQNPNQRDKLWVPTSHGARLMGNALMWVKRSAKVTLSVEDASAPHGGRVDLTATLMLGDAPLSDHDIAFTLNGSTAGSARTDASGKATVTGVAIGSIAAGTHAGAISATFAGAGSYPAASATGALTVGKAVPTVQWIVPADGIAYGTRLGEAHLSATADVAGSFEYVPGAGTLLSVGTHTLSATFTPSDTTAYASVSTSRVLVVNKAKPEVTWATPDPITYPTPLSPTQLNATSNVPGTYAYSTPEGSVLTAGEHEITVTFTPTDTNYDSTTARVTLTVKKAVATLAWANPVPITYGTALTTTQLNATATHDGVAVGGTFTYSPASGAVLTAGDHTLSVTFEPTDAANYIGGQKQVQITVRKATPTVIWADPEAVTYGAPLSSTQLNALAKFGEAEVNGTFNYSPGAGTVLNAGADQTLSVTFVPADTRNYESAAKQVRLTVNKATPTIVAAGGTFTYDGTAHAGSGTATGIANAVLSGVTLGYQPGGTVAPVNAGVYTVVASFPGNNNYNEVSSEAATITINKARPVVTATGGTFTYTGLPQYGTGSAAGVRGEALGTVTIGYAPGGAAAPVNAGSYSVVASIPETANHLAGSSEPAVLTIQPAPLLVQTKDETKFYGAPNPQFALVFSGFVNGETAAGIIGGTPTFGTEATDMSPVGTYPVTPGGLNAINYVLHYRPGTLRIIYNDRDGHRFLQPINMTVPRSSFRAGSTIPAKFQLFLADGVTPISTVAAEISVTRLSSSSSTAVNEEAIELPSDAGKLFRYDPIAQQYVFNVGTKGWNTGTYRITAQLGDGNPVTADVEVRAR